ncbi:MAG: lipid-A-disaccharide synthase [Cytophagales bacterium]|nr:lipid-A-disaccharide synthase [Cytophagales bacterium]
MKYYLVAGERSGDLHGGNLVKAIKKYDQDAHFRGFGGDTMEAQGMELVAHYRELAFMGFLEVLKNLKTISRYLKKCKADIEHSRPGVVILIDYAGFNLKIAKFCKAKGIRVFYYISPKVWAWNTRRAYKLKRLVDRMFVILPFEKEFFQQFDWEVDYVGNPVLDALKEHEVNPLTYRDDLTVALLPGSRAQELEGTLPIFCDLLNRFPEYQFIIAAVDNVDRQLYKTIESKPNATLLFGSTYDLLANARAAVVTSGTATLETALWKVPQVVTYKMSTWTYNIAKRLVKVKYISLVNLIANKMVVKELIQDDFNLEQLSGELRSLMENEDYRAGILEEYNSIYEVLDQGSASENTARLMVQYLDEPSGG